MAEVPEHLLRRAAERKAALEAEKAKAAGGAEPAAEAPAVETPAAETPPAESAVQPKDPSGKLSAVELGLFDEVGEAVRGLLAPDLGAVQFRAHRYGVKL